MYVCMYVCMYACYVRSYKYFWKSKRTEQQHLTTAPNFSLRELKRIETGGRTLRGDDTVGRAVML